MWRSALCDHKGIGIGFQESVGIEVNFKSQLELELI